MGFWQSTRDASGERKKEEWTVASGAGASDASWFVDCVVGGRESDMSAADGDAILKALFACYRSAAEERSVELG